MLGKRVQFDDETWHAVDGLARREGKSFQDLAGEAFADLLVKHEQPVGFQAALAKSLAKGKKRPAKKKRVKKG